MPILTVVVIAILLSFCFYMTDRLARMNTDIKFIRMQFEKNKNN